MSATPNGTVRPLPVCALALALAATLLPCASYAATHHAPQAHGKAVPVHHAAAPAAHSRVRKDVAQAHTPGKTAKASDRVPAGMRPTLRSLSEEPEEPVRTSSRSSKTSRRSVAAEEAPARAAAKAPRNAVAEDETPAHGTAKPHVSVAKADPAESEADRATRERVHAWYKSRGLADPRPVTQSVAENDAQDDDNAAAAPIVRIAPPKPVVAKVKAPAPDLSPVPRKATIADFDRALKQQTQAIRAAQQENQQRTTADDDAAEASTQIPSTAPTERVAAPFTHADLLAKSATADDFNTAARVPTVPVTKTDKIDKAANTPPDSVVLANSPAAAATASPQKLRSISNEIANTPTPKITLPKPVPLKAGPAPAVAAVTAAAKKPKLDTDTAQQMAENNFSDDDDNAPMIAPHATTLHETKADILAKKPVLDTDDDIVSRGTSSPVNVNLYDPRGHLILIPPMKGTHEILVHQNQMAVADGLDRIEDDDQLAEMRKYKLLVALPDNDSMYVNDALPANRRYARPWTVRFLNDLARAHDARFGTPLIITSAVRTVEFQKRLVRTNGNAAPPTGDIASPHLYGQAVDLGKHGMSVTEIAWMRAYLTPVEAAGKIDVEEEFQQACFHISVYRRYLGLPARKNTKPEQAQPQRELLQARANETPAAAKKRHHLPTALLATGLR